MPIDSHRQPKELEFADYLEIFYRRKNSIIIVFAIIFISTLVYQLSRPHIYGSATSFTIDTSAASSGVGSGRYSPYEYYYTRQGKPLEYYQSIISSQVFSQRVVQRALQDSLLRSNVKNGDLSESVDQAVSSIRLSMSEESGLMALAVRAHSAMAAYRVADIATDVFKERYHEIEIEGAQDVVSFIDKQRQEAQARLEQAERDLQLFDGGGNIYFMGQDGGIMTKVNQVEALLEQTETERRLSETNLASFEVQLRSLGKQSANLSSTETIPEIVELRGRLTGLEDQYNALQVAANVDSLALSKLDAQIETMKGELRRMIMSRSIESASGEDKKSEELRNQLIQRMVTEQVNLSSTRNKEKFYNNVLEQYRNQSPELLEKTIELSRLKRTHSVHQNLLNYLVERHEEAKIKAATGAGSIRIISPAGLPNAPLSRNLTRNLLLYTIIGLGLGCGLAMFLEYLDQSIRSKEELERITGVLVIGQIPFQASTNGKYSGLGANIEGLRGKILAQLHKFQKIPAKKEIEFYPLIHHHHQVHARSPFVEAFRDLRTDLQFYKIDQPIKKLLITSAIPGEGKSVITGNLGLTYAELGHRVVIVDCDLRKPKQAQLFSVDRQPGMVEYLLDKTHFENIIRTTQIPGLYLIPPGTLPPNPTEIINSVKFAELIARLESEFDYIFIDSPPLISVSDAKLLSRIIGNILLVFRYGQTEKRYIKETVSALKNINVEIIGFILNGIDIDRRRGYYKYHYYYEPKTGVRKQRKISHDAARVN